MRHYRPRRHPSKKRDITTLILRFATVRALCGRRRRDYFSRRTCTVRPSGRRTSAPCSSTCTTAFPYGVWTAITSSSPALLTASATSCAAFATSRRRCRLSVSSIRGTGLHGFSRDRRCRHSARAPRPRPKASRLPARSRPCACLVSVTGEGIRCPVCVLLRDLLRPVVPLVREPGHDTVAVGPFSCSLQPLVWP